MSVGEPRDRQSRSPGPWSPCGQSKDPVVTNVQVLADNGGEEPGCLGDNRVEFTTVEDQQTCTCFLDPGIDEDLTYGLVVSVDLGLGHTVVLVATGGHVSQLVLQVLVGHLQRSSDSGGERVTVSMVATAS